MNNDLKNYLLTNLRERGLFLVFQIILTLLLPFITTPETFGLLSIIINNISFVLILTSAGIPSALHFYASKRSQDLDELFQCIIVSTIIQLLLICTIEFIIWSYFHRFFMWPSEKILFGILALFFFLGHSLQEKLSATYNGILKYRLFIKISSFFLFVQIVILALNYYFDIFINVFAPIICIIIVTLIQSIVLFYSLFSTNRKGFKGIKSVEWKAYLGFAIPAYIANLIQFLATRSDLWLINYFYNKSEVGYYAFATKIGGLLLFLPILLASILFPLLTSEKVKHESLEKIIKVTNTVLLVVSIPAIVSAIVFIPMIWGDKYLNAIWPFIILLPGYIAQSQTTLYAAFFASISRIKTNMTNSIITFCVFMILSIQFIPEYGIIGAAISLTTANIMGAIWIIRKYNQVTGSLSMRLFLGKQDFIILKQILFK